MWPPDEDDLRIENTIMSLVKQNNNELDIALMHEINNIGKEYYDRFLDMIHTISNYNEVYAFFSGYGDSYILKFKDVESLAS